MAHITRVAVATRSPTPTADCVATATEEGQNTMVTIQNAAGETIHISQNLRGLNEHLRRALVAEVHIRPLAIGGGRLSVIFVNGDSCAVEFASYEVLRHWIA